MIILSAFIFTIEMGIKDTYNGGDSSFHTMLRYSSLKVIESVQELDGNIFT
jgi:hypothetical protein